VLVDVVKCVKTPEQDREFSVPVSVRFETVDSFYSKRIDSLYFSSRIGFVLGDSLRDGKLDFLEFPVSEARSVNQGHLLCEVVQPSPEIVNDISGHAHTVETNSGNRWKVIPRNANGMWRDTRLLIGGEYCRLFCGKSLAGEATQMLFGHSVFTRISTKRSIAVSPGTSTT